MAQAWPLAARSLSGRRLLADVYAGYASYLADFQRFDEAGQYANRTLDFPSDKISPGESTLLAAIICAQAETYRGARPAPRRGLKLLQMWFPLARKPLFKSWMLMQMAECFALEGLTENALTLGVQACQAAEACRNQDDRRLRRLDLAKIHVRAGCAEEGLALAALLPKDTAFRRADVELTWAEGLLRMGERSGAQDWLQRALDDIERYSLKHLQTRAAALAQRFG